MKYSGRIFLVLAALATMVSCEKHFVSDSSYRREMEKDFQTRIYQSPGRLADFYDPSLASNAKEREALEFLYAYMPLADVTDYPVDFHLTNVRATFRAIDEMPWGSGIPELLVRHFVLPLRTNNENLDSFRVVYYEELKERVKGLSMEEAILEVNHWCHERVTYQPSDGRTSSPLNTIKSARGRCGEESTLAVAALRTVGIPARQVYTPRWAHTDDNHAWVEAWAGGKWHFLGACEPEPVLDLAWFNSAASRVMLTHTKAFGKYRGPEEVVMQSPNFTEINLTANYALTGKVDVRVKDENGSPVDSARVDFMIYNYSEFYPAISKYADADGCTFLSAGLGDMLAWASKDGKYGFSRISFGKDSLVEITISDSHPSDPLNLGITPPAENYTLPEVTAELRDLNDRRLAFEDSVRTAYTSTFPSAPADPLLVKSMGNHATISAFLAAHPDAMARELLESLSDKDLRDITMDNLMDSYGSSPSILCPRVENEFLTTYKSFLREHFAGRLGTPADVLGWIRDSLTVISDPKAWNIPMSPEGVWKSGLATPRSRDIFFVSLCRTLGMDAREDPVTGKVQYKDGDEWAGVDFSSGESSTASTGTLVLNYSGKGGTANPKYYNHFTLSKIIGGRPHLMTFDEGQVDMGGGVSWQNSFKNGVKLESGTYIITSGTRLADGSIPAFLQFFEIKENETTALDLNLSTPEDAISVIGTFDGGAVMPLTGRGFYIMGVLGVGQEPTNHTLRDIAAVRERLEAWGRPVLLLTENDAEARKLQDEIAKGNFGTLPSTAIFSTDPGYKVLLSIDTDKMVSPRNLPVFIAADSFGKVYFLSQGYTIGIGERLSGIVEKL